MGRTCVGTRRSEGEREVREELGRAVGERPGMGRARVVHLREVVVGVLAHAPPVPIEGIEKG